MDTPPQSARREGKVISRLPYIPHCVRQLGNFRYNLIPEIINKFMTIMSDPVRAEHVQVFKLKLK
jgi:hypothetical protein